MKKLKRKDILNRKKFKMIELKNKILKNIQSNDYLSINTKWISFENLSKNENRNTKLKITNRCINTISKKSVDKRFKLSRHETLKNVRSGKLSGIKKSVW